LPTFSRHVSQSDVRLSRGKPVNFYDRMRDWRLTFAPDIMRLLERRNNGAAPGGVGVAMAAKDAWRSQERALCDASHFPMCAQNSAS
jgi:hypothetical protein